MKIIDLLNKIANGEEVPKEIKEILDYLKNNTFIPDEAKRKYKILHRDEVNKLLDYITNLQEENERLRKDYGRLLQDNAYTLELEQKIDKAREMIRFIVYNSERPLTITELNKVYNILGGDE